MRIRANFWHVTLTSLTALVLTVGARPPHAVAGTIILAKSHPFVSVWGSSSRGLQLSLQAQPFSAMSGAGIHLTLSIRNLGPKLEIVRRDTWQEYPMIVHDSSGAIVSPRAAPRILTSSSGAFSAMLNTGDVYQTGLPIGAFYDLSRGGYTVEVTTEVSKYSAADDAFNPPVYVRLKSNRVKIHIGT